VTGPPENLLREVKISFGKDIPVQPGQ